MTVTHPNTQHGKEGWRPLQNEESRHDLLRRTVAAIVVQVHTLNEVQLAAHAVLVVEKSQDWLVIASMMGQCAQMVDLEACRLKRRQCRESVV